MTYTLIINPEAQQDIEQAYNYYSNQVSTQVAELFTTIFRKVIPPYKSTLFIRSGLNITGLFL